MMDSRSLNDASGAFSAPGRPVSELVQQLASNTGLLVRQELKLAAGEMSVKATFAGKQAALVAIGSLIGVVALVALGATVALLLALVIPAWAAALVVTAIYTGVAYSVVMKGIVALRALDATPAETVRSLEETKHWAQEQIR